MFGQKKSPSGSKDGLGMEVIWPTFEGKEDSTVVDIVFVHGLRGSRHGTWTKDGVFWPRELLPKDHAKARILTWGYDADVFHFFGPVGTGNINDHSKRLLNDLSRIRFESHERERPLIFIAHSLGGLIVKDALSHSHYQGIERDGDTTLAAIKGSTKGVIFAGTPHRGADKAKWASIARNLAIFLQKDHSGKMIEPLKRGDEVLERLQDRFKYILRHFALYTLLEELEYPKIGKIVEKDSAILGDRDEKEHLIHGDHSSMIKFSSRGDEGYKDICHIIRVIIRDWIGVSDINIGVSPSIPSALTPPLRTTSSRASRRGSPLLIEARFEPSSESQNRPVSPPPSEHGRNTKSASDPELREPLQTFALDIQAHIDEDRILELLGQADRLFVRPHKERSTKDILTSHTLYREVLFSLRKQPSRQHPDLYISVYDKLVQINVTMTYNKKYFQEERNAFLSSAENYAHEAIRWAQSSQDSAAIAKTRLSELFVRARRVEFDYVFSTSDNKKLMQKLSSRIIEDTARALEDLTTSGSTDLDDFANEAQHWTKHLRHISNVS